MASPALRRNIMVPLALLVVLLGGVIIYSVHLANRAASAQRLAHERGAAASLLDSLIEREERTLTGLASSLAVDPSIIEAFASGPDLLYHTTLPIYKRASEYFGLTQLIFFDTDRQVVLRVDAPERKGDRVDRASLDEAVETGKTSSRLDLTPSGIFTLRSAVVIRREGKVLGYLEIGREYEGIAESVKSTLALEAVLLLDKKYLDQGRWVTGGRFSQKNRTAWEVLPNHVAAGATGKDLLCVVGPHLPSLLADPDRCANLEFGGKEYVAWAAPLGNGPSNTVGTLVLFSDVTNQARAFSRNLFYAVAATLGFLAAAVFFFYHRLGREASKVRDEHLSSLVAETESLKEARRTLKVNEERLRAIFDNARVGIIMLNPDGTIADANQTFLKMVGYALAEAKELNLLDMAMARDREELAQCLEDYSSSGGWPVETRLRTASGGEAEVSVSINPVPDRKEAGSHWVAVVQGIGDRLTAQKERDILAEAVEFADESIVVTDPSARIIYVNPAFERTTGYSLEEVAGGTPALLRSGAHDDAFYKALWETLGRGGPWRGRLINKKKNGELFYEAATISPVIDSEGQVVYFVGVKRDVTRENELEASLAQAQKMEAVGTLASGIAHDFNNILHAVTGFTQVLLSEPGLDAKSRDYLNLILDTSGRGADLVNRILTFSRANAPERKPLDLNREIAEIIKMLSKTVPKNIGFDLRLEGDLLQINAMTDQIHQVVMNLCANARDAMPQGGVVTLRTRNVEWSPKISADFPEAREGRYVEFSVEDGGIGMDRHTLNRIYDPFFTTKPVGKGTGLGLATVYGIVKSHDGFISCRSAVGQGTLFTLLFPALAERRGLRKQDKGGDERELKGGTETILLVDDEELILTTTKELLESFGYTVLTAASGEEALELYRGGSGNIGLVLLDLGMPGMGGAKCLEELLVLDPSCKVVIASGYDGREEAAAKGARGYMRKPFRLADLLRQLRKLLDPEE